MTMRERKAVPVENPVIARLYPTTVNATYPLGKLGAADQIRARVEMSTSSNESILTAESIVDGVSEEDLLGKGRRRI
jgi:hypothetical protein